MALGVEDSDSAALFKRTFERLRDETSSFGYEFNDKIPPFHSSYDNWHFFGKRQPRGPSDAREKSASTLGSSRPSSIRTRSDYDVPTEDEREKEKEKDAWVIGRVGKHILRLEREFKLAQALTKDQGDAKHFVRPIDFVRLPARQPGDVPLCVSIVEAPGRNYLREIADFGPAFYSGTPESPQLQRHDQVPLATFLEFAIGSASCLEVLHHGHDLVHGEIRGDAFHYNKEDGAVRMVNFGSGVRSFEHGLTSANWSSLMSQRGVEHRLQFIAPEQTGRLPAEPDARTDIYSLGILYWTMLTGQPAFEGKLPLDIMTSILSRRIPFVSNVRPDVPDAIARVIAKMTSRTMDERYNSTSGVKYDVQQLKRIILEGDQEALGNFKVASQDVSCFFNLPSQLVGREEQRKAIIGVIQRAAERAVRGVPISRKGLYSLSSGSSIMSIDRDLLQEDIGSDSTSSTDRDRIREDARLISIPEMTPLERQTTQDRSLRTGSIASSLTSVNDDHDTRQQEANASIDSRGSIHNSESLHRNVSALQMNSSNSEPSSLFRIAQKLKRKGRTELVGICGAAGYGKSALVQSIQAQARKHGYFTSAKFDQVRSSPFDPPTRLMASLFRQIFSENDVNSAFHDNIRTFVKPFWNILHAYLELPAWLLSPSMNSKTGVSAISPLSTNGSLSMPTERKMCNAASNQEWLRTGGSNKNSKFMHIFIDVLRLIAVQRLTCLCLDDLQFADYESLELISLVVKAHVPVVLILTYRDHDLLTPATRKLLERATTVEVGAFTDDDTASFVADTLHREKEYCTPLVAVVQEKTGGNPFFVREMLDSAYRKKCIYYCWKCSAWEYSLDLLFEEFSSADSGRFSTNDFILRRMRELPVDAQTVLAWASILGNSFGFTTIKHVMSCSCSQLVPQPLIPPVSKDAVAGLQTALNSYVIMATDQEDRFKFSHDRYVAAADQLCDEFARTEMHFVVLMSMLKHEPYDPVNQPQKVLFEQARHVTLAISAIKRRVKKKTAVRELLYQAAEAAKDSGAGRKSLSYFQNCIELLPDSPWSDETGDATYGETLTLKTRAAEAYWFNGAFMAAVSTALNDLTLIEITGQYEESEELLSEVFENARDASDSAPGAIILSRMHAQRGNSKMAFVSIRNALSELGLRIVDMDWDECDEEFQRLVPLLQSKRPDWENMRPTTAIDKDLLTLGALLTEFQSSAYWTDHLLYFQATLTLMNLYVQRGIYPQVAIGYVNMAALSIWRFNMIAAGIDFGSTGIRLTEFYDRELYTIGRSLTLYTLFIGHIVQRPRENYEALNKGLEAASSAGDRILHLLNVGIMASFRLWSSDNVAELEAYTLSIADEFPDWAENLRGGVLLHGVRQSARALAGKTNYKDASEVLSDDDHSSDAYEAFIKERASNPERPLSIYLCYKLTMMYRFGHHHEALQLGDVLLPMMEGLLCMKHRYSTFFYLSMSILACIREQPDRPDRAQLLDRVAYYRAQCEVVASVNSINHLVFFELLDAELADLEGRYGEVLGRYEAAVNYAVVHNHDLDEALSLEVYGDWLVRRGASRPARGTLLDSISAYRRVGAHGKAQHVSDKYEFLLVGTRSLSAVDASTQTMDSGSEPVYADKLERIASHQAAQTPADRTVEWLDPESSSGPAHTKESATATLSSASGLDMIDLAGILESSQLLSSELDVDRLLCKLTSVIIDSTGAELVGLVVQNDQNQWVVASMGTAEGVEAAKQDILLDQIDDPVGRQVTLAVIRFRELIFLRNVLDDERFSNVPDEWLEKNPEGASMIAVPIMHGGETLLGSLYCQAPPNTFTERTVTLLKLLVNQIAISIANALLFKKSEKVQATNESILAVQKQALKQAQEAEKKAKAAEAKAMEMVRLKDEAAKVKSMFLANVSHELRTPLNGVIGMSEMLKSTPLSKEQEEHADSIRVCADTLLSVINDILDFSKLEAGKMQVFSVPLSLTETISEVVRALSYTNIERNLKTIQKLDLDPKMIVMGDPVRLHQVLMNLMSNAYKFTAKGSVTVHAKVDGEDVDTIKVTVSVEDTGIGITEEQQKKLFLPFSQADSSTARSYGGTGLGLSICKAILENVMKGHIWLESTSGVGTKVSFQLTFKKVHQSSNDESNGATPNRETTADPMAIFTPPAEDDGPGARAIMSLQGIPRDQLKVCIAEDNPINQKIAINFVKKLGFNCEAYGDGQQAVDALGRASKDDKPFHLVLMDVQMPVLDGYNATREIRKHADARVRDILVIAMTASAIRGDREKCLEAGMNNYLAKPVRADTLKQMLESYLHQPARTIPNLQQEANNLVNNVVTEEDHHNSNTSTNSENLPPLPASTQLPERPKSAQRGTEIHLTPEEMVQKPAPAQAQRQMRAQIKAAEAELQNLQERPSRAARPKPGRASSSLPVPQEDGQEQ